jgi:YD repeat-containing protein
MIRYLVFALYLLIVVSPAGAQEVPKQKEFDTYTSGGVDLMTGQFKLFSRDISVGSGDFPSRLDVVRENGQYPRQGDQAYATHNFYLTAACFPCTSGFENRLTVKAFDGTHTFKAPYVTWGTARTWTNAGSDGAQVIDNGSTLEFRSKSGDQIFFAANNSNGTGIGCGGNCRVPVYAVMATGESIVFAYENTTSTGFSVSRLTLVTNSRGYGLQFGYVNPSLTSGNAEQRRLLASVSAFRSGCVASAAVSCATGTLASVSYAWTMVGTNSAGTPLYRMTSFTNPEGRVLNYEYNGAGYRMTAAAYADAPSVKLFQNIYATYSGMSDCKEGKVSQQKDALLRTTSYSTDYCYNEPRIRPTVIVTAPDLTVTTYRFSASFDGSIIGVPSSIEQPLGRTLTYTYDAGRLASSTDAEGKKVAYTLDDRGNATTTTITSKTGSTLAPLVESASFPACTTTSFRFCNKPSYTIDARGSRTDYQYDAAHGQPTVVLKPADAGNVRAVIRTTYSAFYPAPGVTAPSGISLVSAYLPTTVDTCLASTVTGTTVDFTYVCPAGSRQRMNFLYTGSTSSSRTNHELEGVINDADGTAARTCYRYDAVGNRVAQVNPRAALASCS